MSHEAFPQGFLLNKSLQLATASWWRKIVLTERALADITRDNRSPNGVFVCMVLPCCTVCATVQTAQCCCSATVSHDACPHDILLSCLFVCVAADCSVCSAVIWTPFCCWRASTTSAPCCCRVRGRTSLSGTPMKGMNQKKRMVDIVLILHTV